MNAAGSCPGLHGAVDDSTVNDSTVDYSTVDYGIIDYDTVVAARHMQSAKGRPIPLAGGALPARLGKRALVALTLHPADSGR